MTTETDMRNPIPRTFKLTYLDQATLTRVELVGDLEQWQAESLQKKFGDPKNTRTFLIDLEIEETTVVVDEGVAA